MSLIYLFIFCILPWAIHLFNPAFNPFGYFHIGRWIDLLQMDLLAIAAFRILRYHRLRWRRLLLMDKKENKEIT